jgi:hypothetical protein
MQCYYSASTRKGATKTDSIRVTFNDGGTAKISSFVKVQFPTSPEHRLLLHQDFSANPANVADAVRSHLVNCIKSTGPMMSASENQASRKAEFNQVVEEQFWSRACSRCGLPRFELADTYARWKATGATARTASRSCKRRKQGRRTEIVLDGGQAGPSFKFSPLDRYKMGLPFFRDRY